MTDSSTRSQITAALVSGFSLLGIPGVHTARQLETEVVYISIRQRRTGVRDRKSAGEEDEDKINKQTLK